MTLKPMYQNLLNRSLVFLIGFGIAIFIIYYLNTQSKLDALAEAQQKEIQDQKNARQKSIDSLQKVKRIETERLYNELENLQEYSNDLLIKIKRYEKRPDFDIDFLTAANIITESNYRPTK